jgi:hypothetical protein
VRFCSLAYLLYAAAATAFAELCHAGVAASASYDTLQASATRRQQQQQRKQHPTQLDPRRAWSKQCRQQHELRQLQQQRFRECRRGSCAKQLAAAPAAAAKCSESQ